MGDAVAELHDAEAGIALATGMAAIHAAFLSLLRAGDRVLVGQVGYGTTRTQASRRFGRLGVDVGYVDTTDPAAVEAALAARPTRILHVETIANPTCVLADLAALADARAPPRRPADGRQHVRLTRRVPAARARRGPRDGVRDEVPVRAPRRDGRRGRRVARPDRRGPAGADRHRRDARAVRGVPRPARASRRSRCAWNATPRTAMALATCLERQDGVRASSTPDSRATPRRDVASRILDGGGAMLSVDLEGGRAAGKAFFDALTLPERTASLGLGPHDGRPPAVQLATARSTPSSLAAAGITEGLLRVSVGLEDEAGPASTDFGHALDAARRRSRSRPAREASIADDRGAPRRPPAPSPVRPGPARQRRLGAADLGQLRRRPDHRAAAVRGRGHDAAPAAGLRVPLAHRLRGRDGRACTRCTTPVARRRASSTCSSSSSCSRCSRSTWFSIGLVVLIISIVACTTDRTPRLWRQSAEIRVVQPDPFFDPILPDRALMAGVAGRRRRPRCCRRHRFVVRREVADGVDVPVRRPQPVGEARDAAQPPGTGPVPGRRGRDRAARRSSRGSSWPRASRSPCSRSGPRGCCSSGTSGSRRPALETGAPTRLHDPTSPCSRTAADRRQDDPRQRPARRSAATRSTRTGSGRRRTS